MQNPSFELKKPCNSNNPYNWIGECHNFLMSYIFTNYRDSILNIDNQGARQQECKNKTNESMNHFYGFTMDLDCLNKVYGYKGLYSEVEFGNYVAIFNNMDGLSTTDKESLIDFFNIITVLPVENNMEISNALLSATQWENTFLFDPGNINNSHVLGAVSVAKYSLYWYATNEPLIPAAKIKWWHVLADAVGGVIGGIAGSAGGPGGTVLGALEGAAAGTAIYDLCTS